MVGTVILIKELDALYGAYPHVKNLFPEFLENWGLVEKTPQWARANIERALNERQPDWGGLKILYRKDSNLRIAVVLRDHPNAAFIDAWDASTGQSCEVPELG